MTKNNISLFLFIVILITETNVNFAKAENATNEKVTTTSVFKFTNYSTEQDPIRSFDIGAITFEADSDGTASYPPYIKPKEYLRVYYGNYITLKTKGTRITTIVFKGSHSDAPITNLIHVGNSGTFNNKKGIWTASGNATDSIIFTAKAKTYIDSIIVTYDPVNISIGKVGLRTYSSSVARDFTNVQHIEAYIVKNGKAKGMMSLKKVNKVPASTGLLLRGLINDVTSSETLYDYIPELNGETDDVTGNLLVANINGEGIESSRTANNITYANYVLQNLSAGIAFYKIASGNVMNISGNKAYLSIPDSELLNLSEEAKPISFSFENATSINILKTEIEETENLKIYNIFGQKVTPNYKGVLIYKGKKYLSR